RPGRSESGPTCPTPSASAGAMPAWAAAPGRGKWRDGMLARWRRGASCGKPEEASRLDSSGLLRVQYGQAERSYPMPREIIDLNAPAHNPATPKPRGLLPVPPEVEEIVAREKARLAPYMTDEAERRIRNDLTLQHYYEGSEV